jgi:hypothetical protein
MLLTFIMSDWWFMSMGNLMGSCAKQLKRLGAMLLMLHYVTGSHQSPMLETPSGQEIEGNAVVRIRSERDYRFEGTKKCPVLFP